MAPRILPAALAALALATPAAARAQGCVGAPVPERALAVQLQAAAASYDVGPSSEGGPAAGVSLRHNVRGPLAYAAEYQLGSVGDAEGRLHSGGAVVALRAPRLPQAVAVCARGGVLGSRFDDSPSATQLDNVTGTVGVVLEAPLSGGRVVPYVAPQYLFSRTRGDVLGLEYESSGNGFGVEAGAGIRAGRAALTLGGTFSSLPEELVTPAASRQSLFVRVGLLF
jgi:hypothetical protein